MKSNAQIAYENYCESSGWKSLISGLALPQWQDVSPPIKAAWENATKQFTRLEPEYVTMGTVPTTPYTFQEYEQDALKTVSPITDQTRDTINRNGRIIRGVLETLLKLGADIDQMKKSIFYGKQGIDAQECYLIEVYERHANEEQYGPAVENLPDNLIDLLHAVFGIVGEGCELVAPILFPESHTDAHVKGGVVEESGDSLWYHPLALRSVGSNLEEAARRNNQKLLSVRYKSGAFSQGEALNRDLEAEGKALQPAPPTKPVGECCPE